MKGIIISYCAAGMLLVHWRYMPRATNHIKISQCVFISKFILLSIFLIHYHCTTGLMLLYHWNVISSLMLYGWSHKPYKKMWSYSWNHKPYQYKPLCLNLFFFFFREFQLMASTLDIRPNVEFRIELLKTNSSLAKSTLQQKTRGYTQKKKKPPTGFI